MFGLRGSVLYQSDPIQHLSTARSTGAGQLEWSVTGRRALDYRIEFSDDLKRWQTLGAVTNASPVQSFVDPEVGSHPHRFYRTVTE